MSNVVLHKMGVLSMSKVTTTLFKNLQADKIFSSFFLFF